MGRTAGLYRNDARRELREKPQDLAPLELLAQKTTPSLIGAVNLKNLLGQIQTDYANLAHGWLPSSVSHQTPFWRIDAVEGSHPPHHPGTALAPYPGSQNVETWLIIPRDPG